MIDADVAKHAAALAAIHYVTPEMVLGVGTGSTVAHFIEALEVAMVRPHAGVATSAETEMRLRLLRVPVIELDEADLPLALYVDGADEIDHQGRAIKGQGGAHRREKRVAQASSVWVCIVDESKLVRRLGTKAPVPLEVETPAIETVKAEVLALGGNPVVREGCPSEAGNVLLDAHGLDLDDPMKTESELEAIPGVLACGIFAHRRADLIIVGHSDGSSDTLEPLTAGPQEA